MIPTWRALPLWAKIVLAPIVISSAIGLIAAAFWALAGIGIALTVLIRHLTEPLKATWRTVTRKFKRTKNIEVMPRAEGA